MERAILIYLSVIPALAALRAGNSHRCAVALSDNRQQAP